MKAILIEEPGAFAITEIAKPEPKHNELLIEVKAVSLCNQHDWKVNKGLYKLLEHVEYGVPGFPGHEGVGIVIEMGKSVKNFNIGDHVVMSGLGGPPLYAEYVTRESNLVAWAKSEIPFNNLAMAELLGCVHRACKKVKTCYKKSITISGCGAAGLAAIQICKAYGADHIIAIDIHDERLNLAKELGADETINAKESYKIKALRKTGTDIVIECSGNKIAYQNSIYIAREDIVVFGYSEGTLELPLWPMFDYELTLHNSKWLTNNDLKAVVNMISNGKINTEKMISVEATFDQYLDVVEMIGRGEIMKAIMTP